MGETQEPSKPPVKRLSWSEAPLAIMALVSARRRGDAPVLVGVTGPVGSGKSTLADRLGGVTVSTDDYLPNYEGLPEHERDLPLRDHRDDIANGGVGDRFDEGHGPGLPHAAASTTLHRAAATSAKDRPSPSSNAVSPENASQRRRATST